MNDCPGFTPLEAIAPFVPPESKLRNLPAGLVPQQRVLFDAVRYSIEVFELSYRRAMATIRGWQICTDHPVEGTIASIVSDAWTMVDALHRLLSVVSALTKGQKTVPGYVASLREAAVGTTSLRNAVQHVSGRVERLVSRQENPWGAVSWVELRGANPIEAWVHTIVPGTVKPSKLRLLQIGGKVLHQELDLFTLESDGVKVCLSEAFRAVEIFAHGIHADLTTSIGPLPAAGSDLVMSARLEAEIPPPSKPA